MFIVKTIWLEIFPSFQVPLSKEISAVLSKVTVLISKAYRPNIINY